MTTILEQVNALYLLSPIRGEGVWTYLYEVCPSEYQIKGKMGARWKVSVDKYMNERARINQWNNLMKQ